jgi:hypothetical protein
MELASPPVCRNIPATSDIWHAYLSQYSIKPRA